MDLKKRNYDLKAKEVIQMPQPLTKEQLEALKNEEATTEILEDTSVEEGIETGFEPEIVKDESEFLVNPYGKLPSDANITIIPIIPGVTKFSYIRFLNANASIGPVDVYVNDKLLLSGLSYQEFTEYMKVLPGYYRVTVFKAGTKENPLNISRINIISGRIYTAALVGTDEDVAWELIVDNRRTLNPNIAYIRFIQISPNAPLIDVYVDDRLVISDLDYREVSRYLALAPGEHTIKLKVAMSGRLLLVDPSMILKGGRSYTVYIVGNMNEHPGLQVLIPLEGVSYLEF